jgi:protein disulfide-isomerase A6
VDCDVHKDIASKFGVQGFPTLKIFSGKDKFDYNGERVAKAIAEAGLAQARKKVKEQLDGGSSGGSSGKSSGGSKDEVIELTDSNFDKLVLQSDDVWLVEFFAPWCKLPNV